MRLHGPEPMGNNSRSSTTTPPIPPIPKGEHTIGVYGSVVHKGPGMDLAMRCRRCPETYQGTDLEVHAALRDHHRMHHAPPPPPPVVTPPKVRKKMATRDTSHLPQCDYIGRKGVPCGKRCVTGRCGQHTEAMLEYRRRMSRAQTISRKATRQAAA
jgi:hypothetical protein